MSKRTKKKNKRLAKSYESYKKLFRKAKKQFAKKGKTMDDDKLMTESEWLTNRQMLIDAGHKTNINQAIVSAQKYKYSLELARRIKAGAKKVGLDYEHKSIYAIRQGEIENGDLSAVNEQLKVDHPDWTGYKRSHYIAHEVFGSE